MKQQPEHLPLGGMQAEAFFTRQADAYSCGPACVVSAAKLYGKTDVAYDDVRQLLSPDPIIGSKNEDVAELCKNRLPFSSTGENTYTGGVAIANIIQDEGHYVLFLKKEGDDVIYYDPYHHELVINKLDQVEWISESGHLKNWSVNLQPLPDDFPAKTLADWRKLATTPAVTPQPDNKNNPRRPQKPPRP